MFGLWCNGSTTGFGSVCPGSNPGSPTEKIPERQLLGIFYFRFLSGIKKEMDLTPHPFPYVHQISDNRISRTVIFTSPAQFS